MVLKHIYRSMHISFYNLCVKLKKKLILKSLILLLNSFLAFEEGLELYIYLYIYINSFPGGPLGKWKLLWKSNQISGAAKPLSFPLRAWLTLFSSKIFLEIKWYLEIHLQSDPTDLLASSPVKKLRHPPRKEKVKQMLIGNPILTKMINVNGKHPVDITACSAALLTCHYRNKA